MMVDVIGVVTEVKPLGSVKRKTDQVELSRRDITLVDQGCVLGRVLVCSCCEAAAVVCPCGPGLIHQGWTRTHLQSLFQG